MAVMMRLEIPGGTTAQYDRVNEILAANGEDTAPDGLVQHVCGATGDGIVVIDIWDSEESLKSFTGERLLAALREAGVPDARPEISQVHAMIPKGSGTDANVIVITELDVGTDVYDGVVQSMDAHLGAGEAHPCVSHAAAIREGGGIVIVDLWDSPEAFGEFAQAQIMPAGGDQMGEIEPRFVPVHHVIKGRAAVNA